MNIFRQREKEEHEAQMRHLLRENQQLQNDLLKAEIEMRKHQYVRHPVGSDIATKGRTLDKKASRTL